MENDQYPTLRAYLRAMSPEDQEAWALKCGTTINYLRKAMSKRSKMDVKLVEQLVVNSGFTVPPRELRPDVEWEVFADSAVVQAITGLGRRRRKVVCEPA